MESSRPCLVPHTASPAKASSALTFFVRSGVYPPVKIFPDLVRDFLCDFGDQYNKSKQPNCQKKLLVRLAENYNLSMNQASGIVRGRYDKYAHIEWAAEGKVRIHNCVMLYDVKGYEPSGESLKGTIEMSDDGLYLRCHECGDWVPNLSRHVREHKLTAKEYKKKHGLKKSTSLFNEPMRVAAAVCGSHDVSQMLTPQALAAKRRAAAGRKHALTVEELNLRGRCAAQSLHDLRLLCDRLGRSPSVTEIKREGISVSTLENRYGSWRKAVKLVSKFPVPKFGERPPHWNRWYSNVGLLDLLVNFGKVYKRQPFMSDCRRGLLPSSATYCLRFGSWLKALKAAGFNKPVQAGGYQMARRAKTVAAKLNAPVPVSRVKHLPEATKQKMCLAQQRRRLLERKRSRGAAAGSVLTVR